jgi:hypothetical protein
MLITGDFLALIIKIFYNGQEIMGKVKFFGKYFNACADLIDITPEIVSSLYKGREIVGNIIFLASILIFMQI